MMDFTHYYIRHDRQGRQHHYTVVDAAGNEYGELYTCNASPVLYAKPDGSRWWRTANALWADVQAEHINLLELAINVNL